MYLLPLCWCDLISALISWLLRTQEKFPSICKGFTVAVSFPIFYTEGNMWMILLSSSRYPSQSRWAKSRRFGKTVQCSADTWLLHTQKWSRRVSFGLDCGCACSALHAHQSVYRCCEVTLVCMLALSSISLPFFPSLLPSLLQFLSYSLCLFYGERVKRRNAVNEKTPQ